jgi:hypothetical protein
MHEDLLRRHQSRRLCSDMAQSCLVSLYHLDLSPTKPHPEEAGALRRPCLLSTVSFAHRMGAAARHLQPRCRLLQPAVLRHAPTLQAPGRGLSRA